MLLWNRRIIQIFRKSRLYGKNLYNLILHLFLVLTMSVTLHYSFETFGLWSDTFLIKILFNYCQNILFFWRDLYIFDTYFLSSIRQNIQISDTIWYSIAVRIFSFSEEIYLFLTHILWISFGKKPNIWHHLLFNCCQNILFFWRDLFIFDTYFVNTIWQRNQISDIIWYSIVVRIFSFSEDIYIFLTHIFWIPFGKFI